MHLSFPVAHVVFQARVVAQQLSFLEDYVCNMAVSQKRMVQVQDTLEENNRKMFKKMEKMIEENNKRSSEAQRTHAA